MLLRVSRGRERSCFCPRWALLLVAPVRGLCRERGASPAPHGHPEGGHEPRVSTARGNRCAVLGGFFVLGAPGDPRTANILYMDKQNMSKAQRSGSHRLI